MNKIQFAKFLMKLYEIHPKPPDIKMGGLSEVFRHNIFVNGSMAVRKEIMLRSAKDKYKSELEYPWDNYFDIKLAPFLQGKVALDLGCFTGGRSTAWFQRYGFDFLCGIDVKQEYIDAATQFAALYNIPCEFKVALGESLPYEDNKFDVILSSDVFEHVQDLSKTMAECYRVLKPGGRLYLVFPGYFHPNEHHLSLVTYFPFIHYFFSGDILVRAYSEILEERGDEASWYKRSSPRLESWEKCNSINGTTISLFRNIIQNNNWHIIHHSKKPIGSVGRNISQKKLFKILSYFLYPLASIPFFEEIFLARITYILGK